MQRTADLRYVGQAFEVRVPVRRRRARPRRRRGGRAGLPRRAPPALRLRLRHRPAPGRRVGQPPGQRDRADPPSRRGGAARRRTAGRTGPSRARAACSSTTGWRPRPTTGPTSRPATSCTGPAIIEEFGSTVPVHPGFAATVDAYGNLLLTKESADDLTPRRSTPTRSSSRSSPARWPRSRRRSRPPSAARRARR